MIVPHPTDEQIRSAHVISFFDPKRPDFHRIVIDTLDRTQRTPTDVAIVDIAVDSTNPIEIQIWMDRIRRLRPGLC